MRIESEAPRSAAPAVILCVDDDPQMCRALEVVVRFGGHSPLTAQSASEALDVARREAVDLVITDQQMPALRGVELIKLLRAEGYEMPVIILTAFAGVEDAVSAMQRGAQQYLQKPVDPDVLNAAIQSALDSRQQANELAALRRTAASDKPGRRMIGASLAFRRLMQSVERVATSRSTVLIEGETGTGKELVAQALHDLSDRASGPFVTLNCAAMPEGLVESALFGHERGAFTGAVKRSAGAFERAHGGTLLLDEISEMRLDLQAKLLRVLQEREFERVGGSAPIKVDVRLLATTNRDLGACVQAGTFREDLYYRLNVVRIVVPPLRERRDDIALLARHFAARTASDQARPLEAIAPEAVEQLESHPWHGNIRELQHTIERAVVVGTGPRLESWHLAFQHAGAPPAGVPHASAPPGAADVITLRSFDVGEAEAKLIQLALERCGHNRTAAAALLGVHVRTLRRKLKAMRALRAFAGEPLTGTMP